MTPTDPDAPKLNTAAAVELPERASSILDGDRATDLSALAVLFEADRDQLRRDPLEAAHLQCGLTVAGTYPALVLDDPLVPDEIQFVFLDGVRRSEMDTPGGGEDAC